MSDRVTRRLLTTVQKGDEVSDDIPDGYSASFKWRTGEIHTHGHESARTAWEHCLKLCALSWSKGEMSTLSLWRLLRRYRKELIQYRRTRP